MPVMSFPSNDAGSLRLEMPASNGQARYVWIIKSRSFFPIILVTLHVAAYISRWQGDWRSHRP